MNPRLPIWLQSLAIACLCAAWMISIRWVGRHVYAPIGFGDVELSTAAVLYWYIPLPIVILGVRFCWRFALLEGTAKKTPIETLFYTVGLLLTVAIICLMLILPAVQRVRDAGAYLA